MQHLHLLLANHHKLWQDKVEEQEEDYLEGQEVEFKVKHQQVVYSENKVQPLAREEASSIQEQRLIEAPSQRAVVSSEQQQHRVRINRHQIHHYLGHRRLMAGFLARRWTI